MNPISEQIEYLGQRFVRDYQPDWEARLRERGLFLRGRRIPIFMSVAPVPPEASQTAVHHLPFLLLALHKALAYALATPSKRKKLLASLVNRQELLQLDIGRLPRPADLFGRFDTFLQTYQGQLLPRVIEANFNNVEGLLFQHVGGQGGYWLADHLGLADQVAFPSALYAFWQWLLSRYHASLAGPAVPTMAIIWDPGHLVKDVELPYAAENFRRWGHKAGIRVITADWRELDYTPRSGWTVSGQPVQIIWKNVGPFYPAELGDSPYTRLAQADPAEICVLSDIIGRLLGSKWLFELLWNPETRHLFDRREWAAISLLVPWTIEVQEGPAEGPGGEPIADLVAWLSAHREQLVLKPVLGSHGEGVSVGPDTDQTAWDEALGQATDGRWIAMHFVPPEQLDLPVADPQNDWQLSWERLYADCNFYMFGPHCGPVVRRAAQSRILNVAQETADGRPAGGVLIGAEPTMGHNLFSEVLEDV